MIYFDHNATTAPSPAVIEAMTPFFGPFFANPSALYRAGRLARTAIDQAREQVAALVNAEPWQVIFTSGGTEANNLALQLCQPHPTLALSAIEHPSIALPATHWAQQGKALHPVPVNAQGEIAVAIPQVLRQAKPGLVSVMLANNETGVLQPVAELAAAFHELGWQVHSDAVQAVGKIAVDFKTLDVDALSLSGHKLHGPKGIGALVLKKPGDAEAMLFGGKQEQGLRAGTENVPAIVGLGKACEEARRMLAQNVQHHLSLRQHLEAGLRSLDPAVVIFSDQAGRLPNTVQFALPGLDGEWLQMQLDRVHIAVSSGSACASGGGLPSPVLTAMGVTEALAKASVRVSLGTANTVNEIDQFLGALANIAGQPSHPAGHA
ncbi:MAG: cysteine desulfurase family protein [Methylococcales bacterium]|nr:cysteine desulfurase family protein [Methylococcales bacterium]